MFCRRSAPHSSCRLNFQCSSDPEKRSRSHWSAYTDLYSCWKYSVSLFPWVDRIRASSPTVKALTPSSFTLKQTKQSTMAATTCSAQSQQPTKQSTIAETTCLSWSQQANKMVNHGNDHLFTKESTSKQNSQLWSPPVYHGVKQIKWSTTAVTTYHGVNKQTKQSTMAATTCLSWSQHANTTVNHSSYHLSWSQWTNKMVNRGSDHLFIIQAISSCMNVTGSHMLTFTSSPTVNSLCFQCNKSGQQIPSSKHGWGHSRSSHSVRSWVSLSSHPQPPTPANFTDSFDWQPAKFQKTTARGLSFLVQSLF